MKINSKLTWGLAWAGLALVLIVPSADFLTGHGATPKATVLTSGTEAVRPAVSKAPAKTVVKTAKVTPKPAPGATLPSGRPLPDYISDGSAPSADTPDVQTASIAPVPYPREMRPHSVQTAPTGEQPLIIDEAKVQPQDEIVTGGIGQGMTLAEYLEQQGLMDDQPSSAQVTNSDASDTYDPDGFFLSDGPNAAPPKRKRFNPQDEDNWDFTLF